MLWRLWQLGIFVGAFYANHITKGTDNLFAVGMVGFVLAILLTTIPLEILDRIRAWWHRWKHRHSTAERFTGSEMVRHRADADDLDGIAVDGEILLPTDEHEARLLRPNGL